MNYTDYFKTAKDIYEALSDDKSKAIFEKRLTYCLTQSDNSFSEFMQTALPQNYKKGLVLQVDDISTSYCVNDDNSPLILYGAGIMGSIFVSDFLNKNRTNVLFCDRNYDNYSKIHDIPVISPEELFSSHSNAKIVITSYKYYFEIYEYLKNNGVSNENIFSLPADYINWIDMYFDPIIEFSDDEVFIDAGALDGINSIEFSKRCPNYKKIYMFEPDSANRKLLESSTNKTLPNSEIIPLGLWSEKSTLNFMGDVGDSSRISSDGDFKIEVNALDNILSEEKITFIKMDIEGAELNALIGSKEIIKKFKPKLAISIYHKPEDIIEIPQYIKQLVPEYRLFIRHYTCSKYDTILYAVL